MKRQVNRFCFSKGFWMTPGFKCICILSDTRAHLNTSSIGWSNDMNLQYTMWIYFSCHKCFYGLNQRVRALHTFPMNSSTFLKDVMVEVCTYVEPWALWPVLMRCGGVRGTLEDTDACMHAHECFCLFADVNRALSAGEIMYRCFILPCIEPNVICRIEYATESLRCWRVQPGEKQIMQSRWDKITPPQDWIKKAVIRTTKFYCVNISS